MFAALTFPVGLLALWACFAIGHGIGKVDGYNDGYFKGLEDAK